MCTEYSTTQKLYLTFFLTLEGFGSFKKLTHISILKINLLNNEKPKTAT